MKLMAIFFAVACLSSCKGKPIGSGEPGETLGGEPETVEMIEPGAEPRRVFVYSAAKAKVKKRTPTIEWKTGVGADADKYAPTWSFRLEWIADRGKALWRFRVADVELNVPDDETMEAGERAIIDTITASFKDTAGRVELGVGGAPRFLKTVGFNTTPSVLSTLHSLTAVFPPNGFGVGARWRVTEKLPLGTLVRRFHVAAINGEQLTIEVEGTQSVEGASLAYEGSFVLASGDPLPISGQLVMTSKMKIPNGPDAPNINVTGVTTFRISH